MAMLKAIHAQEDREAALKKASDVVAKLKGMKLGEAAALVDSSVSETLSYMSFPPEHWKKIRSNNMLERVNREIRRRTRVVGAFPDGKSALMLVSARLRYVAGRDWGSKRYINMDYLRDLDPPAAEEAACAPEEAVAAVSPRGDPEGGVRKKKSPTSFRLVGLITRR